MRTSQEKFIAFLAAGALCVGGFFLLMSLVSEKHDLKDNYEECMNYIGSEDPAPAECDDVIRKYKRESSSITWLILFAGGFMGCCGCMSFCSLLESISSCCDSNKVTIEVTEQELMPPQHLASEFYSPSRAST